MDSSNLLLGNGSAASCSTRAIVISDSTVISTHRVSGITRNIIGNQKHSIVDTHLQYNPIKRSKKHDFASCLIKFL